MPLFCVAVGCDRAISVVKFKQPGFLEVLPLSPGLSGANCWDLWIRILQTLCPSPTNGVQMLSANISSLTCCLIIPTKAREYVFTGVGLCVSLCVCVSVCLSVITITEKIVDGFVLDFMGRFLGGKGRPSSCFVTIGRGIWK